LRKLDPPDRKESSMSVVVLQAVLAGYAAVTFAVAVRMQSRARVVTMAFPHENDVRDSVGRHRATAALV